VENETRVQLERPTDPVSIAEGQRRFPHTPKRQDGCTAQLALYTAVVAIFMQRYSDTAMELTAKFLLVPTIRVERKVICPYRGHERRHAVA
jgi:hypothetical protein